MNSSIDFNSLYKNEKMRYLQLKSISAKVQNGGALTDADYKIMYQQEKQRYLELKQINQQDPTFIKTHLSNLSGGSNQIYESIEKQQYRSEKEKYLKLKAILHKKQSGGQLNDDDYKLLYREQKRKYLELKNK